jgi:hypothetical protein
MTCAAEAPNSRPRRSSNSADGAGNRTADTWSTALRLAVRPARLTGAGRSASLASQ